MSVFEKVKQTVTIFDVVSTYTTLKKAGTYLKGHCPFHSERTASFTISPDKGIFYCFGCHVGGDAIAFIAAVERCTPLEAAHLLAERFEIALEAEPRSSEQLMNKKRYAATCQFLAQWCQKQLLKSKAVKAYLDNRKIGSKAINRFLIGYMPSGQQTINMLIAQARKAGLLLDDLLLTGFLQKRRNGLFCPYEERIIFPISDTIGRFCGFGGRIFKQHDTRPKYYNTPENSHFVKGELLFGLDLARDEIQKSDTVFLVEGYTDCISMSTHGYINTVATLGTACTQEHLQLLARYAKRVYVLYDADKAGIQAVLRMAQLCWSVTLDLYIGILPQGLDPAAYLEKHQQLKPITENAQEIFTFYLAMQAKQFLTLALTDKLHRIRQLITVIARIEDRLKRALLITMVSSTFKIPQELIHDECKRQLHSQATKKLSPQPNTEEKPESRSDHDPTARRFAQQAFFAILHDVTLYCDVSRQIIFHFLDTRNRAFLDSLGDIASSHDLDAVFSLFFNSLQSNEQQNLSRAMFENGPLSRQQFESIIARLNQMYRKQKVSTLKQRLAQVPAHDTQTVHALLQEMVSLNKPVAEARKTDGIGDE